ncbi:Glycosyl-hydrolase 97 C-terminal, oligomerisation [Prevotellaceae bacterium HUN156]|nr:Glycosyl-hydrolase 97 C-terminal, oligomerisation [Prevotellaceae bacterium HUN156]
MRTTLLLLLSVLTLTIQGKETVVKSPDGQLAVTVNDEMGQVSYSVTYQGKTFLKPSALGLKTDIGDFTRGLTLKDVKQSKIDKSYQMLRTKASSAHYVAQQADFTYLNSQGLPITITFCVSNNDIAFRYSLQPKGESRLSTVIYNETTSFNFPEATTTFLTPQSLPMVGWQRTKPSYEEDYKADMPMTQRSAFGEGFTFPCLFKVPTGWVLVSETGVGSNYCGSHLSDYEASHGYTIAFPNIGEMNGLGSHWAGIPLPGSTPWRTITLGTTLKPIVETTIPYDVVEPLYEPTKDYQPGRYTWSWLLWGDESVNYDDQVKMIDLSAAMGYEYVLVDNWWDKQIGRDRIVELNRYANSKGVKLLLWYNSNGYANDAPQTPKHCMNTSLARNREMAWLQKLGIAGIKVDFLGSDKQENLKLYEDILADANRYGLQVVFHGCTIPRGWERMYPNYVASEACLASENVNFSEYHAKQEGFELTMHPFARNAVGSFDWGGIIMNRHISRDNKSRHRRYTTDIFEMASGIVLQTSVNCVAIYPNNLQDVPQFELDFLKQLPTTWDETRFIDGYPTKYAVLARRTGQDWYVAGLNGEQKIKTLQLSLPMFAGQTVKCYIDQPDKLGTTTPVVKTLKVGKNGIAKVTLQPLGGIILTR